MTPCLWVGSHLGQRMHILEIRDEWARIRGENGLNGWLRWCDRDGKLLIAVEG